MPLVDFKSSFKSILMVACLVLPLPVLQLPNSSIAQQAIRTEQPYSHLVYDQVIWQERGPRYVRMMQRIPTDDRHVTAAVPIEEGESQPHPFSRESLPFDLFRPQLIVTAEGNQVLLRDTRTEQHTVLVEGPDVSEFPFANKLNRTAISPNGRKLLVALISNYQAASENPFMRDVPLFDLYVIDLFPPVIAFPKNVSQLESSDAHKPQLIRKEVRGNHSMSSSLFDNASAPPIFWVDDDTILFANSNQRSIESDGSWLHITDEQQTIDLSQYPNSVVVQGNKILTPTHDLFSIKLADNSSEKVCDLTLAIVGFSKGHSIDFWRRSDGAIMLSRSGIDFRIDFENHQAIEDRKLSPEYELRGDPYFPSLWYREEMLCEKLCFRHVSVSPDGESVAWFARTNPLNKTALGNISQFPTTLWFHSGTTGKIEMAEGNFEHVRPRYPFESTQSNPCILWSQRPEARE